MFGDYWNDLYPTDYALSALYADRYSSVDFSGFLSIDSVENLGPDPNAVPIPATLPLLGFGLAGLAAMRRRFRG